MKFKLNKKFKRKWINALRSGKYSQATGSLKACGGYCCLSVACDVAGIPEVTDIEWGGGTYEPYEQGRIEKEHAKLAKVSSDAQAFKKLSTSEGDDLQTKLIEFNDTKHRSFAWIANYIEKHL